VDEFFAFAFHEACDGDSCPLRDDLGDVLGIHFFLEHGLVFLEFGEALAFFVEGALEFWDGSVAEFGGSFEVGVALCFLEFDVCVLEGVLDVLDFLQDGAFTFPVGF